ncbi:MAG: hypothetical protein ABW088_11990 [Sedimenticola sp.]
MQHMWYIVEDFLAAAAEVFFDAAQWLGENWILWILLGLIPTAALFTILRLAKTLPNETAWELSIIRGFSWLIVDMTLLLLAVAIFISFVALFAGGLVHSPFGLSLIWNSIKQMSLWLFLGFIIGFSLGRAGHYWVGRNLEPRISMYLHRKTRKADTGDRLTDVRNIEQHLPKSRPVNIYEMFARARSVKGYYFGIDSDGKPVFVSQKHLKSTHVLAMGASGLGKGIQLQILLAQAIQQKEAIFFFDPKRDEWLASLLAQAAELEGLIFIHIDFKADIPHINPLKNISADDLFELLVTAFDLSRKGEAADYYRLADRKAAWQLSRAADHGPVCFSWLFDHIHDYLDDELLESAKGFINQLEELSRVRSICTFEGPDISDILETGGVFHFSGAMRGEVIISLQKLVALRMIQIVENRTSKQNKHVFGVFDEFRFIGSDQTVKAQATARDKQCTLFLSVQTRDDVLSIPGVDGKEAKSVVETNCRLKWIYRMDDLDSATWAAGLTGKMLAEKERTAILRNELGSETSTGDRFTDQTERFYIDENMIQNLPNGCALMIGDGRAKLVFATPIPTEKRKFNPTPATPYERDDSSPLLPKKSKQTLPSEISFYEDPFL